MAPQADGYWRWVVVVAAFFTHFIVCGITYSLGVFHVIFKDIFYETHFDISWIGSILLYVTALSSIMFRFVTSFWGPRISIILGGLIASTGLGLCMLAQELLHFYLCFGLLTGLGFGMAFSPSIVAIERHFISRRFQAMSIAAGGIGAGIIMFPMVIRELIIHFAWRGAMLILAGIALNLCVCGMIMSPTKYDKELRLKPMLSCLPLRHPLFHGMCLANLFWSFGSTIIYMYLPSYAMSVGTSFELSVFLVSCIGMASFCTRFILAFLGPNGIIDSITPAVCPILLGVVLTGTPPLLFDDFSGQIAYAILFGFFSAFWTTFLSQVSRELFGPEYIAMGNGYQSLTIAVGSLAGGPITGLLLKIEGDFDYVFHLAGACLLFSSVIMVVFKLKRCRIRLDASRHTEDSTDFSNEKKVKQQNMPFIVEEVTYEDRKMSLDDSDIIVENVVTSM